MIADSVLYIFLERSGSHAVPRHCDELSSTALRQLMLLGSRADPRLKLSGGPERRSANRPVTSDVSVHLRHAFGHARGALQHQTTHKLVHTITPPILNAIDKAVKDT